MGLANAARNNVRAIGSNYVRDNSGTRLATPAERSAIQSVGQDRFNRVMRNESGAGEPDVTQRQRYFDDRSARRTLGVEAHARAKEGELRALGGPYMSENGQTRLATPEERQLVNEIGQSRFNRLFSRQPQSGAAPASQAQQSGGPGYDEPSGERRSLGSQMRQAFSDSYEQHMADARVPLIRDQSGRVVPDSEDGKTARATMGDEEYGAKASRQIRYMGSGAWANVGGRPTPLSADQSHARSVMGNEEFSRSMDRSIRSTGVRDEQGRSLIMDEGEQRAATRAEQQLLDDQSFGEGRFNRMMGERGQFMGEGNFVRDNGTPRIASRNESALLGQVGEERFNDVMGRRFEDAGTGYRVDAMPTRGQVIEQARTDTARIARAVGDAGGEAVDRGRDAIQDSGLRAGGLADVGSGMREEIRGEEQPQAYDAQRAARSERRRRAGNSEFFGMKTDME